MLKNHLYRLQQFAHFTRETTSNLFQKKITNTDIHLLVQAQQQQRDNFHQQTPTNFLLPIYPLYANDDEKRETKNSENNWTKKEYIHLNQGKNLNSTKRSSTEPEGKSTKKHSNVTNSSERVDAESSLKTKEDRKSPKYRFLSHQALNGNYVNPKFFHYLCSLYKHFQQQCVSKPGNYIRDNFSPPQFRTNCTEAQSTPPLTNDIKQGRKANQSTESSSTENLTQASSGNTSFSPAHLQSSSQAISSRSSSTNNSDNGSSKNTLVVSDDESESMHLSKSLKASNITPPSSTFKIYSKIISWGEHSYTLEESLPDSTTQETWDKIANKYIAILNEQNRVKAGVNRLTLSLDRDSKTIKITIPSERVPISLTGHHVEELLKFYPFPMSICSVISNSSDDDDDQITQCADSDGTGSIKRHSNRNTHKPSARAVQELNSDTQSESSSDKS